MFYTFLPLCRNVSLPLTKGKLDGRSGETFEQFERRESLLKDRYPAADWNGRAKLPESTKRARDFSTVTFIMQATSESELTYPKWREGYA